MNIQISNPTLHVEGLSYSLGGKGIRTHILKKVDLTLAPGELVILAGPSGSGKSTLLSLIGCLRKIQDGQMFLFGKDVSKIPSSSLHEMRRRIGFIFQQHNLLEFLTATKNVEMSLEMMDSSSRINQVNRASDMLEKMSLGACKTRYPHQMSVGQCQRVAIARALVHRPELILADEPTASLDKENGIRAIEFIRGFVKKENNTALVVTHDSRIFEYADRILYIEDGRIINSNK